MRSLFRADNPIFRSESAHYTRSLTRWPVYERRAVIGLLVAMSLLVLVPERGVAFVPFALWALWGFHALVALRLIVASVNTISREYTQQTWEALILTGLSARQIFLGKWYAILKRARFWFILLTVVWMIIAVVLTMKFGRFPYRIPEALLGLLGVVSIPVLAALETLGCTALGIMASAITKRTAAAAVLGGVLRLATAVLLWFSAFWVRSAPPSVVLLGLADAGTFPSIVLMIPGPGDGDFIKYILISLALAAALLASYVVVSVIISLMAIRRSGALRHVYRSNVAVSTG
jgi:hypothetical protein